MTELPTFDRPIIDACLHNGWADQIEVVNYMSAGWREYVGRPGLLPDGGGSVKVLQQLPFRNPNGETLADSDGQESLSRHLDRHGIERAVLNFDQALFAPSVPNAYLARELCRAANDWSIDSLVEGDDRLYGLVLAPNQVPQDAVAEIRRVGEHPRMVGVMMGGNGVGKVLGHPIFHPIYETAAEMGLPVVVHVGGDSSVDTTTSAVAAGIPLTYGEYASLRPTALMTHLVTMIVQGVFRKFPDLRVLIMGGGTAWLPSLLWRLDTNWRGLRREVPWIDRPPSEYLREHVRISTWPLDGSPDPGQLVRLLTAFGGVEDLLCYASAYPYTDSDFPINVAERLPAAWHDKVFYRNAADMFRWSPRTRSPQKESVAEVGQMPVTGHLGNDTPTPLMVDPRRLEDRETDSID